MIFMNLKMPESKLPVRKTNGSAEGGSDTNTSAATPATRPAQACISAAGAPQTGVFRLPHAPLLTSVTGFPGRRSASAAAADPGQSALI